MLSWTRWAMWKHIIFAILGTLVVAGGLSACDPIAPDVVGQALPDAIQRLENSGYSQLRVIDDSGATITRTHYEDGYKVTTQDKSGSDIPTTTTITLTVTESHITSLMSTPSTTPSSSPLPTHSPSYTPSPMPTAVRTKEQPEPAPVVAPAPVAPAHNEDDEEEHAYYANCREARAAGAAPLYVGDPGYRPGLDRDRDGIACE